MRLEIHHIHHHHYEGEVMAALDDLITEVQENRTVIQSAVTLLDGLKTKLDEALASGNVEARVREIVASLDQDQSTLAQAIERNTPADPTNPGTGDTGGTPGASDSEGGERV